MLNLKQIFVISLFLFTTLFSTFTMAGEQIILHITNDDSSTSYNLIVNSVESTNEIKTFYKDIYENGKKTSRITLDYHALISNGIVLDQRGKYVTMKLKSNNFDEQQGGLITIDTLLNGATGSRKTYEITLAKDTTGWAIASKGSIIKQLLIQVNKVRFIGTVGIKNLIMK